MRALVIDDSRAMRMIIRTALQDLGYSCEEACDGKEALGVLQKSGPFDIALVDWNMPVLNGFEFVKAVRQDHAHNAMKLMMVTTEVETSQVCKALEAGANEYLMKPFTKDVLKDKLQMLVA